MITHKVNKYLQNKKYKSNKKKRLSKTTNKLKRGSNNNNKVDHGSQCSKNNMEQKIVKNSKQGYPVICKKGKKIPFTKRMLKTSLYTNERTKKNKSKYFKKIHNDYKICLKKPCWHKLSKSNKKRHDRRQRQKQLASSSSSSNNGQKKKTKPETEDCLAKKGWSQRNNDCWLDSALWALFYSNELEIVIRDIINDIKKSNNSNIQLNNYFDSILEYIDKGLKNIDWSRDNTNCKDDRNDSRMSCKQKTKNKISKLLNEITGIFACDPEDCIEDQGMNDPSFIFNIFKEYKSDSFDIIELSNLEDRKLSNIKNTDINFGNKDIIVVRKLVDGEGDGGGIIDTNISDIKKITNNGITYNLISIMKTEGQFHYVAGGFCDKDKTWYSYDDHDFRNNHTIKNNDKIREQQYINTSTLYIIYKKE